MLSIFLNKIFDFVKEYFITKCQQMLIIILFMKLNVTIQLGLYNYSHNNIPTFIFF